MSRTETVRMISTTPCHVPVVAVYVTERLDVACLPAVRPVPDAVVKLRPDRLVLDVAE